MTEDGGAMLTLAALDWIPVLKVASGVGGLTGVLAVLYFRNLDPGPSRSVVEEIAETYKVPPEQIQRIVKTFKSDEARLQALEVLLSSPREQTKDVLEQLTRTTPITRDRRRHEGRRWFWGGIVAITLSLIGFGTALHAGASGQSPGADPGGDPNTEKPGAGKPVSASRRLHFWLRDFNAGSKYEVPPPQRNLSFYATIDGQQVGGRSSAKMFTQRSGVFSCDLSGGTLDMELPSQWSQLVLSADIPEDPVTRETILGLTWVLDHDRLERVLSEGGSESLDALVGGGDPKDPMPNGMPGAAGRSKRDWWH
jgi:hypothetical protein